MTILSHRECRKVHLCFTHSPLALPAKQKCHAGVERCPWEIRGQILILMQTGFKPMYAKR